MCCILIYLSKEDDQRRDDTCWADIFLKVVLGAILTPEDHSQLILTSPNPRKSTPHLDAAPRLASKAAKRALWPKADQAATSTCGDALWFPSRWSAAAQDRTSGSRRKARRGR